MTPDMKIKLKRLLVLDEGYRLLPYHCTAGKLSIGIGRNLDDRGILPSEADLMCDNDMEFFYNRLNDEFEWFKNLSENRQIALVDMCFMGFKKFCAFKNMIYHLSRNEYNDAAKELLDSNYAHQVGERAIRLAEIIKTGNIKCI